MHPQIAHKVASACLAFLFLSGSSLAGDGRFEGPAIGLGKSVGMVVTDFPDDPPVTGIAAGVGFAEVLAGFACTTSPLNE